MTTQFDKLHRPPPDARMLKALKSIAKIDAGIVDIEARLAHLEKSFAAVPSAPQFLSDAPNDSTRIADAVEVLRALRPAELAKTIEGNE
jgi:hypothetical protein